jgi:oxygen-dependent protoporphyrinogen oxidase
MDSLVARLAEQLERTRARLDTAATRVSRAGDGWRVTLAGGAAVAAEGVVLATPAYATAELLAELDAELASASAEIPYASSVVVTLAFSSDAVPPLDGYGYVVPRVEGSDVLACTWSSQKWEARAPDDAVLVRVYAGRFGGRDLTIEPDEELIALARDELRLHEIEATPTLTRVHRWPHGMPQYVLGHPERLERIEERLAELPGLALAGAAYRGVGIPDCIRSGEEAAESVTRALARTA